MKNCLICKLPQDKWKLTESGQTCSWKCAGKLASKVKKGNLKFKSLNTTFATDGKEEVRKFVLDKIEKRRNKRSIIRIVDLFGGGKFLEYLINNLDKNKDCLVEIYEVERDKSLHYAMRTKIQLLNHFISKNKVPVKIVPHYSDLKYIRSNQGSYQPSFDVVWLDFCGTATQLIECLPPLLLTNAISPDSDVIVTLFAKRDNLESKNYRKETIKVIVNDYLPNHGLEKEFRYGNMVVYSFCQQSETNPILNNQMPMEDKMAFNKIYIETMLPELAKASETEAEAILLTQAAFAADYQPSEFSLLGRVVKYLGEAGLEIRILPLKK